MGVFDALAGRRKSYFAGLGFFSTEVKEDKKATEGENGKVLNVLVLWQFACWRFSCFLDDLLGIDLNRSPWTDGWWAVTVKNNNNCPLIEK